MLENTLLQYGGEARPSVGKCQGGTSLASTSVCSIVDVWMEKGGGADAGVCKDLGECELSHCQLDLKRSDQATLAPSERERLS